MSRPLSEKVLVSWSLQRDVFLTWTDRSNWWASTPLLSACHHLGQLGWHPPPPAVPPPVAPPPGIINSHLISQLHLFTIQPAPGTASQHTVTKHSTHSGKESVESCCGDDDVNDKDYLDMTSARCWEAKFPNIDLEIKIEKFCLLSSQRTCPAGPGRDVWRPELRHGNNLHHMQCGHRK